MKSGTTDWVSQLLSPQLGSENEYEPNLKANIMNSQDELWSPSKVAYRLAQQTPSKNQLTEASSTHLGEASFLTKTHYRHMHFSCKPRTGIVDCSIAAAIAAAVDCHEATWAGERLRGDRWQIAGDRWRPGCLRMFHSICLIKVQNLCELSLINR